MESPDRFRLRPSVFAAEADSFELKSAKGPMDRFVSVPISVSVVISVPISVSSIVTSVTIFVSALLSVLILVPIEIPELQQNSQLHGCPAKPAMTVTWAEEGEGVEVEEVDLRNLVPVPRRLFAVEEAEDLAGC